MNPQTFSFKNFLKRKTGSDVFLITARLIPSGNRDCSAEIRIDKGRLTV
jgi:acyl-coenzyme A thioesterase PaaI-like protein